MNKNKNEFEKSKTNIGPDGILQTRNVVDFDQIEEMFILKGKPLGDRVYIQMLPNKEITTSSGVILPPSQDEIKGIVVGVNDNNPNNLKIGDIVMIDWYRVLPDMKGYIFIEGFPITVMYDHLIMHNYNVNVADWKKPKLIEG